MYYENDCTLPRPEVVSALEAIEAIEDIGIPKNYLANIQGTSDISGVSKRPDAAEHRLQIIDECTRIRVLFDTDQKLYDEVYIGIIEQTWVRTFGDTKPELLVQAVQEFIVSDKKGYLPKPGQIIESLVKNIKRIESRQRFRIDELNNHYRDNY